MSGMEWAQQTFWLMKIKTSTFFLSERMSSSYASWIQLETEALTVQRMCSPELTEGIRKALAQTPYCSDFGTVEDYDAFISLLKENNNSIYSAPARECMSSADMTNRIARVAFESMRNRRSAAPHQHQQQPPVDEREQSMQFGRLLESCPSFHCAWRRVTEERPEPNCKTLIAQPPHSMT